MKSPLKRSKEKAWKAFSIYIRTRFADEYGMVRCVTCPTRAHWKEVDAGHFLSGRHNAVLFDDRNCHVQCKGCNIFGRGRQAEYLRYMKSMYGDETIDELLELDRQIIKYRVADFQAIEEKYKEKVNE